MKPQVVTWHLNKLLDPDAIVSSDSGTIATWAARYIETRNSGSQVVCVVGDDGVTMLLGEIATLVKKGRLAPPVSIFPRRTSSLRQGALTLHLLVVFQRPRRSRQWHHHRLCSAPANREDAKGACRSLPSRGLQGIGRIPRTRIASRTRSRRNSRGAAPGFEEVADILGNSPEIVRKHNVRGRTASIS